MEGDGPSGLRRTLSRTMSSLFPNLYRFSNFSGLSEDEIYAAITQQLEQQQSEEENSPETEEFHDPKSPPCVSSKSSSESECFYDAIGAAAQSPQSKKSPVSPLQSKDSLAVSGTPRGSMFDSLSDGESTLSEALRSSSSTPKSFTIITTPPQRFSPVPDSRCSFLEFLQESEKGSLLQAEEEPVDMLTVLRDNEPNEQATEAVNVLYGQQNLDEEIDLKTALETTSDFSQEANLNASPLETQQQNSHTRLSRSSNVHENSSLSELRSALGSATEIVEDFGNNLRRSLFVRHPPPPEHRRRGSFLKRTIPLAGFFDETSENDDRFETDSMISTLTDALTLKSTTELSSNPARLTRTASVLIPTTSTEADRFESERKLRASRRYKPVPIKVKSKTKTEFGHLHLIQELNRNAAADSINTSSSVTLDQSQPNSIDTSRAIFTLKFSPDGNYLAAAGAEGEIRIWRLLAQSILDRNAAESGSTDPSVHLAGLEPLKVATIFEEEPIQVLRGHEGEVLELSWSSNNFLLSASMDKTVRLWHYSRSDCLGIFEHLDYVTSVAFHPKDPRIFVSGSLDCKLRLWSIQDKAILSWNELPPGNFITAVAFTRSGKTVLAGTAGGIALIFATEGLRYYTQVHVRSSKSKTGKKITGIEAVPGQFGDERVVVSSNDSRIRMYSLRDKNVLYKYKGHENSASQIKCSLSTDGDYVLSGSEDCRIYIWNSSGLYQKKGFFSSFRKDHVLSYESFKAHSNPVTAAVLAPASVQNLLKSVQLRPLDSLQSDGLAQGQIIVTADITGQIKVFENNSRLKEWLS